jgi:uncharacterized protein (TIGR03435 family)
MVHHRIVASSFFLLTSFAGAQAQSFEVASIRQNNSGSTSSAMGPRGTRLVATNVSLRALLLFAFAPPDGQFFDAQIVGGPAWLSTERFDIEAKPAGGAAVLPGEQTKAMLRALLASEFKLNAHRETRDLPVYTLVRSGKGPTLSEDQTPPELSQCVVEIQSEGKPVQALRRGGIRMILGPAKTTLLGTAVSMTRLIALLQSRLDRIVVDKTGITSLIDVHMEYGTGLAEPPALQARVPSLVPGNDSSETRSESIFTTLVESGLAMRSSRQAIEVLVVDSVQHPPLD